MRRALCAAIKRVAAALSMCMLSSFPGLRERLLQIGRSKLIMDGDGRFVPGLIKRPVLFGRLFVLISDRRVLKT